MIVNYSLNDNTQKEILKHLETTSHLLSKVGTKLSGRQKESTIYAMPDLGIAQNGTRMLGGFYTGACYTWDSDIPFVPVDATVNVCGTTVYRLKEKITTQEFKKMLDDTMKTRETYLEYARTHLPHQIYDSIDVNDESKFFWNYNVGNHFAILAEQNEESSELPQGQYMIVHASAIELKKDNLKYGLYPIPGNWYYDDIQTEFDTENNRYLRYIYGEKAIKFNQLAQLLQTINKDRNRYFCKKVLGNLAGEEVINLSHYGMPTNNAICLYRTGQYTPPGAETTEQVDKRVCDFVESLFRTYKKDEKILIVTHNGVMRSIKRNFVRDYDNIMSKNLGTIILTEEDFKYYKQKQEKKEVSR